MRFKLEVAPKATWTPTQIETELSLWFDASSTNSITQSGGAVSQWTDKVTGVPAVQNVAGQQPGYISSGINRMPSITFNGTSQSLQAVQQLTIFNGQFSIFFVLKSMVLGTYQAFISSINSSGRVVAIGITNTSPAYLALGSPAFNSVQSNIDISVGTTHIVEFASTGGISNGTLTILPYIDGVPGSGNLVNTAFSGVTLIGVRIGSDALTGGDLFNGYISEVVCMNTLASTTNRQLIEGYLAWKWGLVGNLPSTHPYKNTAP